MFSRDLLFYLLGGLSLYRYRYIYISLLLYNVFGWRKDTLVPMPVYEGHEPLDPIQMIDVVRLHEPIKKGFSLAQALPPTQHPFQLSERKQIRPKQWVSTQWSCPWTLRHSGAILPPPSGRRKSRWLERSCFFPWKRHVAGTWRAAEGQHVEHEKPTKNGSCTMKLRNWVSLSSIIDLCRRRFYPPGNSARGRSHRPIWYEHRSVRKSRACSFCL